MSFRENLYFRRTRVWRSHSVSCPVDLLLETGQEAWDGAALSDRCMHLLVPANSLQRNNHAVNVTSQLPTEAQRQSTYFCCFYFKCYPRQVCVSHGGILISDAGEPFPVELLGSMPMTFLRVLLIAHLLGTRKEQRCN